jgi:hypothetical protein
MTTYLAFSAGVVAFVQSGCGTTIRQFLDPRPAISKASYVEALSSYAVVDPFFLYFFLLLRSWLFIFSPNLLLLFCDDRLYDVLHYRTTTRPDIHDGLTSYDLNILEYPPKCIFRMSGRL